MKVKFELVILMLESTIVIRDFWVVFKNGGRLYLIVSKLRTLNEAWVWYISISGLVSSLNVKLFEFIWESVANIIGSSEKILLNSVWLKIASLCSTTKRGDSVAVFLYAT